MNYDNLINDTIKKQKLKNINNKFYLNEEQIEVLTRYQIPFETCNSINEIIFYIEDILNEEDGDFFDLEEVSMSLSEFDYYHNYHK